MVGSGLVRQLQARGDSRIITRNRTDLDLRDQAAVMDLFKSEHIDQVYLAAATVGGIHANWTYPANFIYDNLMIACNVIHSAHLADINELLFLGSSCIYPESSKIPITEDALMRGIIDKHNEPYAISKIAGIKLCESYNRQFGRDYRSLMPANVYGPNDSFHPENSHVVPALMKRLHHASVNGAEEVTIWGTGEANREFLHVDDLCEACVFSMNLSRESFFSGGSSTSSHINVGTGLQHSIRELADMLATLTKYNGSIKFDRSRPDGVKCKTLDVSRINKLGWSAKIRLEYGLESTYKWYTDNHGRVRS